MCSTKGHDASLLDLDAPSYGGDDRRSSMASASRTLQTTKTTTRAGSGGGCRLRLYKDLDPGTPRLGRTRSGVLVVDRARFDHLVRWGGSTDLRNGEPVLLQDRTCLEPGLVDHVGHLDRVRHVQDDLLAPGVTARRGSRVVDLACRDG